MIGSSLFLGLRARSPREELFLSFLEGFMEDLCSMEDWLIDSSIELSLIVPMMFMLSCSNKVISLFRITAKLVLSQIIDFSPPRIFDLSLMGLMLILSICMLLLVIDYDFMSRMKLLASSER